MTGWVCLTCGREDLDSKSAARGHVKFSGGDHGDRMELPADWEDHVGPVDAGDAGDDADDAAGDGADDAADGRTNPDGQADEESDPSSSKWRRALFGDVRELFR